MEHRKSLLRQYQEGLQDVAEMVGTELNRSSRRILQMVGGTRHDQSISIRAKQITDAVVLCEVGIFGSSGELVAKADLVNASFLFQSRGGVRLEDVSRKTSFEIRPDLSAAICRP
ncbi:hypothetical protein A2867_02690 [Candidatus Daviesbacteria bacterium RIFCSPHIGHO2_01_FULL_40_11]|uniref:Uncharacterized protein n=1 Tax=Candidatus Daviesbacteria bacterium RIFCSPHIGHO2_01_FULL_40_11 TaxID=1797762 RepID=A0A1F5JH18_9BACT|nr:MAG: hypothetical protein A2867_02690 [Candidatus Daviesbacteria bacterium RIFCSPHIGHO2_01_FULL_40_11]